MGVSVRVRNVGLESRPYGKKNPMKEKPYMEDDIICDVITLRDGEGEHLGQVYVLNGGKLRRTRKSGENVKRFLNKPKNVEIQKLLGRGLRYSEIHRIVECSPRTIGKVKKLMGEVS